MKDADKEDGEYGTAPADVITALSRTFWLTFFEFRGMSLCPSVPKLVTETPPVLQCFTLAAKRQHTNTIPTVKSNYMIRTERDRKEMLIL